jgi:tetratricopeptide (TPR) repeat protein
MYTNSSCENRSRWGGAPGRRVPGCRWLSILGVVAVLAGVTPSVAGQTVEAVGEKTISIVVQDLRSTGGIEEEDLNSINEYLRGQIGGLPNYRVVEQSRITELMEVNERQQLSGLYDGSGQPEQLRLIGADQVILGSVGALFDRIVVSVRLVELVTGEIVFSYTSHAREKDVVLRLDEIVQRIREYGLLRYRVITVADIQDLTDRKRYAEAQERLEAYFRQQRRESLPVDTSAEFLQLQQEINDNLYQDYLKQARRARRRDDYVEARRAITRAIALQPSSEALEERDRIRLAQEEYQREIERQERLIELRAEEQQRREGAGVYLSPLDAVGVYFATISTKPHRLSVSRMQPVGDELTVPDDVTRYRSWGFGYSKAFTLRQNLPEPRALEAFGVGRIALDLDYQEKDDTNTLSLHPVLSPHTGFTVHIMNILLTVGVDGGVLLRYGEDETVATEWSVYPTAGAYAVGDVMILRNLGVHLGARLDYLFGREEYLREQGRSPFVARLFTGVSL